MNTYAWVLTGALVLSALLTVGAIGRPRKPISPVLAVTTIIFNSGYVYLVYLSATS